MSDAEPVHRRGTQLATDEEAKLEPEKKRSQSCLQLLRGHLPDIYGVLHLVLAVSLSHFFLVPEALDGPHMDHLPLCRQILHLVWLVLLSLFCFTWAGLMYHGPGRPPAAPDLDQTSVFPAAMVAALDAGRHCRKPFGPEDSWCRACDGWKPTMANHCGQCRRCTYFMDHHCNFAGQCVGYRNLRCYIVGLTYGNLVCAFLAIVTVMRIWLGGLPQSSMGTVLSCVWLAFFSLGWKRIFTYLRNACWEVLTGWRSAVLRMKFSQLQVMGRDAGAEFRYRQANDDELQTAFSNVIFLLTKSTHPVGPFLELDGLGSLQNLVSQFAGVFGEPPSWRWLLPFRPGGEGDPLKPKFNPQACELWAALGSAVGKLYGPTA